MTRWKVRAFIGSNELHLKDVLPSEVNAHSKTKAREKAADLLDSKSITYDRLRVEKLK